MIIPWKTVLITGGAGFIGSHLVEALLDGKRQVICVDNFNDFYNPAIKENNIRSFFDNPAFHLYREDICNKEQFFNICRHHEPDCIVHLAAYAGVRPSIQHPERYERNNCYGSLVILEAVRHFGVKSLIQASSSSVYGNNEKVPFSEDDNVDFPISPYAATKKSCELMSYTYHHLYNIPITNLRFFTVYGPRQRPEMAIHKFTRLIYNDEPVPMFGDGSTERDYTYIGDVVPAIMKAMEKNYPFEIFNIGGNQTISLRYMIQKIGEYLGKRPIIEELSQQPGDVRRTMADITKAESKLDYPQQRTSFDEGLKIFVEWFKEKNSA